ncbi:MAG: hypothetical protein IKR69_04625 [Bacteroidales bacterium]|nr:hypothetical protein [Bacteroidales bacterium]
MKYSALILPAILMLSLGCAKENNNHETEVPAGEFVEYSFNAEGEAVKATIDMDNGGTFAWSAGDKIAVLNSIDSKYYVFSAQAADGVFKGSAPAGADFNTAYYPASVVLSAEEIAAGVSSAAVADANALSLPASYTLSEASAGKAFPMRGTVSSNNISFTHLGALIRVSVNEVPADATTITLSSSKKIAGEFTATLSGNNYCIAAADGASSVSIDLNLNATEDLEVYFPIPVGTYNLSLTVSAGSFTLLSQPGSSDRTWERANYAKMDPLYIPELTTDYKLIGRYNIGDTEYNWGTESLVLLESVTDHYGWFKATVNVPDFYIDFKLYKEDGGIYTGNSVSNGRKIVGTMISVADDSQGDNFTVYTNRHALDVYFSPVQRKLFTLPMGADFVVPTTEAGSAVDEYALIGWHADDGWASDFFLEGVYGFDDWRVVRIGTNAADTSDEPHFSFKFRRNGGWSEQIGGIYDYKRKANTFCYAKTSNNSDLSFYPGAAGEYDIYLNKDLAGLFVLPAGTAFNVPGRKEQEDLVSILSVIGGINGTNWSQAYPLEFASADNHEWYALKDAYKIDGWGAMVFKLYNGGWGKGLNIGWPAALDGAIGDMNTVYPLWLRDSDADIPNIQLGTDGGHADIYIKADLSEIFTLTHGAPFAVPSSSPAVAPKAVFIGDSITYFWNNADRGNPSFFTTNNIITKGVEGQTSATIKSRFNYDVISNNPEIVHILCGTNDLAGNGGVYVAPADICQNIADMAAAAKNAGIDVLIGSVLPCNYFWWNTSVNPAANIVTLNALLKALCEEKGYTYVNYYDSMVHSNGSGGLADAYNIDGCHPSKAGYSVMESIVLPLL